MPKLCPILVLCCMFSGCLSDSNIESNNNSNIVIAPVLRPVPDIAPNTKEDITLFPEDARGVWVEINRGSNAELNILKKGIPMWEPIVDYVIVSTTPGHANIYRDLKIDQKTNNWGGNVPIIPGLKPADFFDCPRKNNHAVCELNDPLAWKQYGAELRKIISATQSNIVVLENETLLYAYVIGEVNISPNIIEAGLKTFPKNVTYYWYPPVSSFYVDCRIRQTNLMEIVANILTNVRFVDLSHSRHSTVFRSFNGITRTINRTLSNKSLVNMIYVYPKQDFWRNDQVEQLLLEIFSNEELVFYPGQAGFIKQGEIFSRLLPHLQR